MRRLLIFNPDTEYALASDSINYTPPASVVSLRRMMALYPAVYASRGDAVMLCDIIPDEEIKTLPYSGLAADKDLEIIRMPKLHSFVTFTEPVLADPWGWNRCLAYRLTQRFRGVEGIPDETTLDAIRNLSHRRTTVDFLRITASGFPEISLPEECLSVEHAMSIFTKHADVYFKAPWSSSGRGVIRTSDLDCNQVEQWVRGVIATQGSVMAEKAYARKLDFATEWHCRDGKAHFAGYSVFETSRRGKYHRNLHGTQTELEAMIRTASDSWNDGILEKIRVAIEQLIAHLYSGPLGIDMLVTDSGTVNPCVEINLRRTMGMERLPGYF